METITNPSSTPASTPTSTQKLYRSERHNVVGGVCAGMAMARGYSITLVRMVALGMIFLSGMGLAVYLIAWVLLPKASRLGVVEPVDLPHDPLKRSGRDKLVGGVCAGLARYFEMDATLVRIIFVCLVLFAGLGLLPYLYAWVILPIQD